MTNEEINKLEAGRELDILIAEKLLGVSRLEARVDPTVRDGEPQFHWGYPVGHDFAPNFSTDIAGAWRLVEHLREQGWIVRVQEMPDDLPFLAGSGWESGPAPEIQRRAMCQLYRNTARKQQDCMFGRDIVAFGETTALAICRAALTALEVTQTARAA
jgi:hypothetical protein